MLKAEDGLLVKDDTTKNQETRKNDKKSDLQAINKPKVLMYHRIVDDESLSAEQQTCLHVDDFKQQMKLLNQLGYTPVTLRDYKFHLEDKLSLPRKPVILTFDDGYEDFYRLAYPVLQEQGMKAVLFVLGDRSISVNKWDADTPDITKAPLMNDEQIAELHSNGFEIGAHTLNHSNLQKLNAEESYQEVYKPKLILEALLGSQVISLSYPFGIVDDHIKKQVDDAGYEFACSVFSGPLEFCEDPLEIRRIPIHNSTSLWSFMMRLVTPYEYIEWMWWRMQQEANSSHKNNGSV